MNVSTLRASYTNVPLWVQPCNLGSTRNHRSCMMYAGRGVELLRILSSQLNIPAVEYRPINGTGWRNMYNHMDVNEIDITSELYTITDGRMPYTDFAPPIVYHDFVAIGRKGDEAKAIRLLYPIDVFPWKIWVFILGLAFLCSLTELCLQNTVWHTVARISATLTLLLTFFIEMAFCSLVKVENLHRSKLPFDDFNSVVQYVESGFYRMLSMSTDYSFYTRLRATDQLESRFINALTMYPLEIVKEEKLIDTLIQSEKRYLVILDDLAATYWTSKRCDVYLQPLHIEVVYKSFAMRKTSGLHRPASKLVNRLIETGIIDHQRRKYEAFPCPTLALTTTPTCYAHIQATIWIWCIGLFFALVVHIGELATRKRKLLCGEEYIWHLLRLNLNGSGGSVV